MEFMISLQCTPESSPDLGRLCEEKGTAQGEKHDVGNMFRTLTSRWEPRGSHVGATNI
jgi:hypothetical protein